MFRIVRFTIARETLHALSTGSPERRRVIREVEWGAPESDLDTLVSPPLTSDDAAALRIALAGAEGVTEMDLSAEYVFGHTNAPPSYDGFGTLTVSGQGDERLVAIRKEHFTWQVSRYASGFRRFRPASPEPAAANENASEVRGAPKPAASAPAFEVGTVVHVRGRSRRYVVVGVETLGGGPCFSMVALSGSVRGCYPTAVSPKDLERDADQVVAFTGASAATLKRKYEEALRLSRPSESHASAC